MCEVCLLLPGNHHSPRYSLNTGASWGNSAPDCNAAHPVGNTWLPAIDPAGPAAATVFVEADPEADDECEREYQSLISA